MKGPSYHNSQEVQFVVDFNAKQTAVERVVLPTSSSLDAGRPSLGSRVSRRTHEIPQESNLTLNLRPPASTHIRLQYTGGHGCPSYVLNLDRALLLHDRGNTWNNIAKVMGVQIESNFRCIIVFCLIWTLVFILFFATLQFFFFILFVFRSWFFAMPRPTGFFSACLFCFFMILTWLKSI